jgi:hypothetical protein
MALDINAIRGRLNKLQNTQRKSDSLWKPTPGKHQVRIVPYQFEKDNPFIELYFHYNINNKTYLSPQSFGRPDPIVEFGDSVKLYIKKFLDTLLTQITEISQTQIVVEI